MIGKIKRCLIGILENKLEKIPQIRGKNKKNVLGYSNKGLPINCLKIGNGPIKIFLGSGIHGNEIGTIKLAYYINNWAQNNIGKFKNCTLFIVPCLNPDGFDLAKNNLDYWNGGRIGRFNSNRVDLNRNFETPNFDKKSVWSFGKNYSKSQEVYCGEYGNSEKETKLLVNFIKKEKIGIVFMFHNAGQQVMGNKNPLSQKLVKIYCYKTGFEYVSELDWKKLKQTGTMKEWCDINHITYIEIEGSTRWGSDWKRQKGAIEECLLLINKL